VLAGLLVSVAMLARNDGVLVGTAAGLDAFPAPAAFRIPAS